MEIGTIIRVLDIEDIKTNLKNLEGWLYTEEKKHIEKQYKFRDFNEAWGFMSRVALIAESMDHHPTWNNTYNKVHVVLTTHDVGGVTKKDIDMARSLEDFFE